LHLLQVFARPVKSIFNVFHIFTSPQLVLDGLPSAAFNGAGSECDEAISLYFSYFEIATTLFSQGFAMTKRSAKLEIEVNFRVPLPAFFILPYFHENIFTCLWFPLFPCFYLRLFILVKVPRGFTIGI